MLRNPIWWNQYYKSKVLYNQILQIYSEYACREVKNVPNRCTDCPAPVYVLYTLHGITSPWPWWGRQRSSFRLCPVSFHSPSTACWCSDCPGTNSPAHDTLLDKPWVSVHIYFLNPLLDMILWHPMKHTCIIKVY